MADPGFPVGGAWTSLVGVDTFRKFCMSKRKNLDPWGVGVGACAGHAPRSANAPNCSNKCLDQFLRGAIIKMIKTSNFSKYFGEKSQIVSGNKN